MPPVQAKIEKWGYIKLRSFFKATKIINCVKRQFEKTGAICVKTQLPRVLQKLKTNKSCKNDPNMCFPKEGVHRALKMKICTTLPFIRGQPIKSTVRHHIILARTVVIKRQTMTRDGKGTKGNLYTLWKVKLLQPLQKTLKNLKTETPWSSSAAVGYKSGSSNKHTREVSVFCCFSSAAQNSYDMKAIMVFTKKSIHK